MLNALGLGFIFQAKDEASEVIHKLHEGVEELEHAGHKAHHSILQSIGMSGKAIAGMALAVGGAAAVGAWEFAEASERFGSAIRQAGVAAHATTEELEEFEAMAKSRAFDALKGSAVETAQVLAELAKEGYNLEESGQALDGTLNLMRISMGALGAKEAAGLVNDTLGQFGMKADEAGELADKLAFAMGHFGFRAEELSGVMSGLASGAKLTNSSLDDTLIGVGLIKQVFPSATKAASAMNVALQQLASTHTQKELAGIGVAVKDTHGKMLPLLDVMKNLAARTQHMTEAQISHQLATIGSSRAAGGLSVIIDALKKGVTDSSGVLHTGADALAYYRKQLTETDGTAKRMADMLGDDLGGALKALKGALSNAAVGLGSMFEGGFKTGVQNLNLLVRGLTQLFTQGGFSGDVKDALDKHLGIKEFAIQTFIWIERIKNFFTNLGESFQTAFAPFKPILSEIADAFGFLGQELGLTGQGADDNASKWDSFGAAGARVGALLAEVAGVILPLVKWAILGVAGGVQVAKDLWESFGDTIGSVWGLLSGFVRVVAGLFSGNWKMVWDGVIDVVANAALAMVNIIMGIAGWIGKAVDKIGGMFGKDLGIKGGLDELKKEWTGNIKFGANELKAVVQGEPSPAKAAIEGQAKASGAAMVGAVGSAEGSEQHVHSHVSLHVDGEKIAEATASAKRSAGARSFRHVPAHEGGF